MTTHVIMRCAPSSLARVASNAAASSSDGRARARRASRVAHRLAPARAHQDPRRVFGKDAATGEPVNVAKGDTLQHSAAADAGVADMTQLVRRRQRRWHAPLQARTQARTHTR